ncbi:hypothetical protein HDU91_007236 [Kappamyces sp. JEL0680]|nr:hypothetical protein HDU91_007236 [Kappamyces sp. JEL0680]
MQDEPSDEGLESPALSETPLDPLRKEALGTINPTTVVASEEPAPRSHIPTAIHPARAAGGLAGSVMESPSLAKNAASWSLLEANDQPDPDHSSFALSSSQMAPADADHLAIARSSSLSGRRGNSFSTPKSPDSSRADPLSLRPDFSAEIPGLQDQTSPSVDLGDGGSDLFQKGFKSSTLASRHSLASSIASTTSSKSYVGSGVGSPASASLVDQLKRRLERSEETLHQYEKDLVALQDENGRLAEATASLKKELQDTTKKMWQDEEDYAIMEQERDLLEEENERLKANLDDFLELVKNKDASLTEIQNMNFEMEEGLTTLKESFDQSQAQLKELQAAAASQERNYKLEIQTLVETYDRKIIMLESVPQDTPVSVELATAKTSLEASLAKVAALEAQLEGLKCLETANQDLTRQLAAANTKVDMFDAFTNTTTPPATVSTQSQTSKLLVSSSFAQSDMLLTASMSTQMERPQALHVSTQCTPQPQDWGEARDISFGIDESTQSDYPFVVSVPPPALVDVECQTEEAGPGMGLEEISAFIQNKDETNASFEMAAMSQSAFELVQTFASQLELYQDQHAALKAKLDQVQSTAMETRQTLTMRQHYDKEVERWIETCKQSCTSTLDAVHRVNHELKHEMERAKVIRGVLARPQADHGCQTDGKTRSASTSIQTETLCIVAVGSQTTAEPSRLSTASQTTQSPSTAAGTDKYTQATSVDTLAVQAIHKPLQTTSTSPLTQFLISTLCLLLAFIAYTVMEFTAMFREASYPAKDRVVIM